MTCAPFDVYSTRQALVRGAREANPQMQGVVGNTGTFIALKAASPPATPAPSGICGKPDTTKAPTVAYKCDPSESSGRGR